MTWKKADQNPLITPGIGKTHLAIGLGVKVAHAGYSVLFDTASNWITRLAEAHQAGRLEAELKKIRRYRLIIIDLCRDRDYAEYDIRVRGRRWLWSWAARLCLA